jgi:hypothetical protein
MDHTRGVACIPNIGPTQRRKRVRMGLAALALAVATAGVLLSAGAPRPFRLVVFVPALAAALGLLQARAQTCVALAAQGRRDLDGGAEAITDPAELRDVRAQARTVNLQAGLLAAATTALLVAWP